MNRLPVPLILITLLLALSVRAYTPPPISPLPQSEAHEPTESIPQPYEPPTTVTEAATTEAVPEPAEFTLTAYCPCTLCCGEWANSRPCDADGKPIVYTASGARAVQGVTISADTDLYPYGTELVFGGTAYIVQDCGGGIKGNRIDVYFDNHSDAVQFGRRTERIYKK